MTNKDQTTNSPAKPDGADNAMAAVDSPSNILPLRGKWNPGDPTDGKLQYQFQSEYPFGCRVEMFLEAIYLAALMVGGIYLVAWYVGGSFLLPGFGISANELPKALHTLIAFPITGLIGGTMFGLKWQYRVSARGWWHRDRRIWRIFSPWLSAALALMIGVAIDGGLLGLSFKSDGNSPVSTLLSVGFVTGYFADSALAKFHDIAAVIFSTPTRESDPRK
jgi:hypothetical protein